MLKNIKLIFSRKPSYAQFYITFRCNSRCESCLFWKKRATELSLKEKNRILDNLYEFGIRNLTITGGEPLMSKDVFELLDYASKKGFSINLNTNGVLLNEKIIDRLLRIKHCNIIISLDSLRAGVYKKIRGIDALDIITKNILALRKKSKRPVRIFMTVSNENYKEVYGILEFCKANKIQMTAYPVMTSSRGMWFSGMKFKENRSREIAEIFMNLAEISKRERYLFGFSEIYKQAAEFMEGKNIGPCGALKDYLQVTPEGRVSVCPEFSPFGDLKKSRLSEIFNSKKWENNVRQCYMHNPCFIGCTRTIPIVRKHKLKFLIEAITSGRILDYINEFFF